MKHLKLFENFDNEVVDYLYKQLNKDKKEYTGHIKTEYNPGSPWKDDSWIVDEILIFLQNDYMSSYTLNKFSKKYGYDMLNSILKYNFPSQYEKAKMMLSE